VLNFLCALSAASPFGTALLLRLKFSHCDNTSPLPRGNIDLAFVGTGAGVPTSGLADRKSLKKSAGLSAGESVSLGSAHDPWVNC
jgi:hypothetical protein